jgi:hypothetical protein
MSIPNIFNRTIQIRSYTLNVYLTVNNNKYLILECVDTICTNRTRFMIFLVKIKNQNNEYLTIDGEQTFFLEVSPSDNRILISNKRHQLCCDYMTEKVAICPIHSQSLDNFKIIFVN